MDAPEMSERVRELIDQLGRAFVQAIVTDEAGQDLLRQIQETGFDVGLMLEATVALHPKRAEDDDEDEDEESPKKCPFYEATSDWGESDEQRIERIAQMVRAEMEEREEPLETKNFEWSAEDKALLCNFRISID